jgi:hypothetical protein
MYEDRCVAWRDGWNAHVNGAGVDDNPYDEKLQAVSHVRWSGGWTARFGEEKLGGDTSADDECLSPYNGY